MSKDDLFLRFTFLRQCKLVFVLSDRKGNYTFDIRDLNISRCQIRHPHLPHNFCKNINDCSLSIVRLSLRSFPRLLFTLLTARTINPGYFSLCSQFCYNIINNIAFIAKITLDRLFKRQLFFAALHDDRIWNRDSTISSIFVGKGIFHNSLFYWKK